MRPNESGGVVLHDSELLVAVATYHHLGDEQNLNKAANAFRLNEMMKADERHYEVIGGGILRTVNADTTITIEASDVDAFALGVSGVIVKSREGSRLRNFLSGGFEEVMRNRKMKTDSETLFEQLQNYRASLS